MNGFDWDKWKKWWPWTIAAMIALLAAAGAAGWYFASGAKVPVTAHVLASTASSDSGPDSAPAIAEGNGTWVVVWQSQGAHGPDFDILIARSTNAGSTWSGAALLNANGASDGVFDNDTQPAVGTDGQGTWLVVWSSQDDISGAIGTDSDLLYARSTDDGKTWTAPAVLNGNAQSDPSIYDTAPALATDGAGNWVVFWQNAGVPGTFPSGQGTFYARSGDNGQTWSGQDYIPTYGGGAPDVATDGQGTWTAAWWAAYQPPGMPKAFYILSAVSKDNGKTWTAALNLPHGMNPADSYGPSLATDGGGTWVAAWPSMDDLNGTAGTDVDVLIATSTAPDSTWGGLTAVPSALTDAGGTFDFSPSLATDGSGAWVVVWGTYGEPSWTIGTDHDILVSQSTDKGATWSASAPLNSEATSDSGADGSPAIAIDTSGNAVVVWSSTSDLGGIGTDADILVARLKVPLSTSSSP